MLTRIRPPFLPSTYFKTKAQDLNCLLPWGVSDVTVPYKAAPHWRHGVAIVRVVNIMAPAD
jgi:hypothetical protein